MSDIRNDVTKQNGGDSVGTLYRRSMDRLMIRDVQRKEISGEAYKTIIRYKIVCLRTFKKSMGDFLLNIQSLGHFP